MASPGLSTNIPTKAILSLEDETEIYAAVVRQLATIDDTFGGTFKPLRLFIIRNTDERAGDPTGSNSPATTIPQIAQDKIIDALKDLSADIVWIDRFEDAEFEEGGNPPSKTVKDHGAIITLGWIHRQNPSSAQLVGSIYVANLAAGGRNYILEKKDGVWKITGTTGVMWIS